MRTYPILETDGRLRAFMVENTGLGRRRAVRVVEGIQGVVVLTRPKFLSWFREEVFCTFQFCGRTYEIEEPYGDNSLYWVGPVPPEPCPEVEQVHAAFRRSRDWSLSGWWLSRRSANADDL